jgi:hypothetical protein
VKQAALAFGQRDVRGRAAKVRRDRDGEDAVLELVAPASVETIRAGRDLGSSGNSTSQISPRRGKAPIA